MIPSAACAVGSPVRGGLANRPPTAQAGDTLRDRTGPCVVRLREGRHTSSKAKADPAPLQLVFGRQTLLVLGRQTTLPLEEPPPPPPEAAAAQEGSATVDVLALTAESVWLAPATVVPEES